MNIAENLLIKYQMLLNSLCLGMEFFFEMVMKNVEELPLKQSECESEERALMLTLFLYTHTPTHTDFHVQKFPKS
jgi:hypothetical protein